MAIKIHVGKQHQEIHFTAEHNDDTATVELMLNHDTGKWHVMSGREEHVSFEEDTIEEGRLRLKAIEAALKYLKDDPEFEDYPRVDLKI
jgi:hypothetical protein